MQQQSSLPRSTGAYVKLRVAGRVSLLELNDPSHFNALSMEMASDMQAAARWLAAQEASIGSVVLQGAGNHFCPGGNLHSIASRGRPSLAAAARGSQKCCAAATCWRPRVVSRVLVADALSRASS